MYVSLSLYQSLQAFASLHLCTQPFSLGFLLGVDAKWVRMKLRRCLLRYFDDAFANNLNWLFGNMCWTFLTGRIYSRFNDNVNRHQSNIKKCLRELTTIFDTILFNVSCGFFSSDDIVFTCFDIWRSKAFRKEIKFYGIMAQMCHNLSVFCVSCFAAENKTFVKQMASSANCRKGTNKLNDKLYHIRFCPPTKLQYNFSQPTRT